MSLTQFLSKVVYVLEAAGVPSMLTGSLAAAYYGLPRATQDVDLVIDPELGNLTQIVDGLLAAGFYVSHDDAREAFELAGQFNAIDPEDGWKVDLIVRKHRAFSRNEFDRRQAVQLLGVEIALATVEDLLIAKLEWSELGDSELQRRDIDQLLALNWDIIDRAYIESWADRLSMTNAWKAAVDRTVPGESGGDQNAEEV